MKQFVNVGVGVIESDYRGEVGMVLFNYSAKDFIARVGDRIAGLILKKIETLTF